MMTPAQYDRLVDRLADVRNTDELFDLELRLGPFDEEDAIAAHALFRLSCARCQLSRGPAMQETEFALSRLPPAHARERFEVRGRIGTRIVRIGWADGELYGSLYALRILEAQGAAVADARRAHQRIRALLDVVLDEERMLAVA
jgi:hypothetical protein